MSPIPPPALGEPYLLTPGPLTTSYPVKRAMLRDWGSWDADFRAMTAEIRARMVDLLGPGKDGYECVPMQGSGSFCVEAMLGSLIPRDARVLVLANGAYGQRAAKTLRYLGREHRVLDKGDYLPPRGAEVARILAGDHAISHVVAIHCETSSGILNPIQEIAEATAAAGAKLLIDSMSAFGALPLDPQTTPFDAVVTSANMFLEGVPGFVLVLVHRETLEAAEGISHSLALDLYDQWQNMEATGQWRFTPPTHVVAAFLQALDEHTAEGGIKSRGARYAKNRDTLVGEMRARGFETLLSDDWLSPIIVTFFCPDDPNFDFARFYDLLKADGFIIYPGKLTAVDSFRIGCIGHLDHHVMTALAQSAERALKTMGVRSAAPGPAALNERNQLVA